MAYLTWGGGALEAFETPRERIYVDHFKVNSESIYGKLTQEFSIFKTLIDRSVLYKTILNDLSRRLTLFIVPDSLLPAQVIQMLMKLDQAECRDLIGSHLLDFVQAPRKMQSDSFTHQTLNEGVWLNIDQATAITMPYNRGAQKILIKSEANAFRNGYVYVIDRPIVPEA